MHASEEVDLDVLGEPPDGISGSVERLLRRLDDLRTKPAVVSFIAVIVGGVLVLAYLGSRQQPNADIADLIPEIRLETTVPVIAAEPEVIVHVAGAVVSPGVYSLSADARVLDAITAAGGPTPDGLIHRLNLAAAVADGMQVRVPVEGEVVVDPSATNSDSASGSGPVNLNNATAQEMEVLRGIGPSLAAAIVSYRDEMGLFASVEDLLDVPGIGPAKLEMLRDQVVL